MTKTPCRFCGHEIEVGEWPLCPHARVHHEYRPFKPYFDIGLGQQIDSFGQRETVRKSLGLDWRDQPTNGDMSARLDRSNEIRRERQR